MGLKVSLWPAFGSTSYSSSVLQWSKMVTLGRVNSSVAAMARMMSLQDSQCSQFASDALDKEELVKRRDVELVSVKTTVKLCAWR